MNDLPPYWPGHEDRRFAWPRTPFDTAMLDRVRSLAAGHPGGLVAISRTAALLHGLETLPPGAGSTTWPIEFAIRDHAAANGCPDDVRCYQWAIPDDQRTVVNGIVTTDSERTLVDCARTLPRLEAQAAVDQLARSGANLDRARAIARAGRWHPIQIKALRSIINNADHRTESPMESWHRRLIIDAELPAPRPQTPVMLPDGRTVRLDLGFERFGVGAEYDGVGHHTDPADRAHDRERRAAIARAGWRVIVFRADTVLVDPEQMLRTLVHELLAAGWDPPPGRLDRISRRINFIAMRRRLEREAKFAVKSNRVSGAR